MGIRRDLPRWVRHCGWGAPGRAHWKCPSSWHKSKPVLWGMSPYIICQPRQEPVKSPWRGAGLKLDGLKGRRDVWGVTCWSLGQPQTPDQHEQVIEGSGCHIQLPACEPASSRSPSLCGWFSGALHRAPMPWMEGDNCLTPVWGHTAARLGPGRLKNMISLGKTLFLGGENPLEPCISPRQAAHGGLMCAHRQWDARHDDMRHE